MHPRRQPRARRKMRPDPNPLRRPREAPQRWRRRRPGCCSAPGVGPFHPSTSVLQAIHAAALHASAAAEGDEQGDGHEDGEGSGVSTASLWERTHTLEYGVTPKGQPLPSPPPSSGSAAVLSSEETADAAEALAALGSVERRAALGGVLSALRGKLCDRESVANVSDATRSILTVLSVLHTVSTSASRIINLGEQVDDVKVTALSLPADAFLSSKLAGKMVRQLQDTLALCSGSLPTWCTTLARACPFLFPFETRQQLFYYHLWSRARASPHARPVAGQQRWRRWTRPPCWSPAATKGPRISTANSGVCDEGVRDAGRT